MPIWFYGIFLLKKAFFKITRVLNRLFTRISLLAPIVLSSMHSLITVIGGLIAVKMFINYFNKLFNAKTVIKTLQTSRKKICLISNFFSSIGIIFTKLVSFSSIIILGLIAMPLWLLGMLGLWGMLLVVNKIVGFISKVITINSYLSLLDLQMFLTALGIIMFQMSIMAVLSVLGVIGSIGVIAFLVSMTLVMLAMMGFGYLLTAALPVLVPALAGFAVVFVVISLLALMALMLSSLAAMDLDKKKVLNSVHTVLGTATAIIDSLFGSKDDSKDGKSGESKSWYSPVLNWMGGNIKMLSAILAVPFLAISIVSIGLILFMATQLRLLQNLDLKKNLILNNVEVVLDTVKSVINSLFGPLKLFETGESKTWYGSVLNWMAGKISGVAGLFEAILAIPILVTSMISIGLILFMSLQLRLLQNLDLKKNLILNNVSSIIKTCQMVSSSINTPTDDTIFNKKSGLGKLIAFLNPNLSNIVDAISSVPFLAISSISIGMLGLMVDNLNKIQSFKLEKGIDGKTKDIIKAAKIVSESVLGENGGLIGSIKSKLKGSQAIGIIKNYKTLVETVAGITRISWGSIDEKVVKNNENITDNYIKFVDKINTTDIKKLETSVNLFSKMADFSKSINGNFEKLAESINEDLMPVLEELKETLNKIPDKIDTNAASVSQSVAATAGIQNQPSTQQGMTEQVLRENPGMSQEDVKKMVDNRLSEQARMQSQSLESKFDELIELLKSGQVRFAMS